MKIRFTFLALLPLLPASVNAELYVVIVTGLGGDAVYTEQFRSQQQAIETASQSLTDAANIQSFAGDDATRSSILAHFEKLQSKLRASDQLSVFLVGHGSYDDVQYKFNLPGPDLTGEEIVTALDDVVASTQLIVNTSSASGALADQLQRDNRIVILATRSGAERHATRFGTYFAAALADSAADIDKNQLVTAEEAFNYAKRQVTDFFERNDQLATEHPQLEGERSDRLSLSRIGGARPNIVDVALAGLVAERDALNAEIESLRLGKDNMVPDEYQAQLLQKILELARIEDAIEQQQGGADVRR